MTTQPNETPAAELKRLLERFGTGLADQPSRVGGLLRDTCGQFRLEIALIVSAAEEGVAADLLREVSHPTSGRIATLARRLEANRGISESNARWAVESWARALGVPTSAEAALAGGDGQVGVLPSPSAVGAGSLPHAPAAAVMAPPPPETSLDPPLSVGPEDLPRSAGDAGGGRQRSKRRVALMVSAVGAILIATAIAIPIVRADDPQARSEPPVGISGAETPPSSGPTGPTAEEPPPVRAPVNFGVLAKTSSSVSLIWERAPNGSKVDHFAIYRDGELLKGHIVEHRFTDEDVKPGRTYRYEVEAIGVDGSDATSKLLRVTVPQVPSSSPSAAPPPTPPSSGDPSPTCSFEDHYEGKC